MLKEAKYRCWGFGRDPIFPEYNKVVYTIVEDWCVFSGIELKLKTSTINAAESIIKAISDQETLQGAVNRVKNAQSLSPGADFYVGLEGGVEDVDGELHEFAWIVVQSRDGKIGKGKTCTFLTPPAFRKLVLEQGKEIGEASDIIFGESNSKQKMGAIGLLTKGVIDRIELYRHAVVAALIPFTQTKLYHEV